MIDKYIYLAIDRVQGNFEDVGDSTDVLYSYEDKEALIALLTEKFGEPKGEKILTWFINEGFQRRYITINAIKLVLANKEVKT